MKDANLEISFKPLDEPTIEGIEFVEFLISPNRGEPLKSLNKIASGLTFKNYACSKSIFVKSRGQTAILFDEVDSGVSGQAAQKWLKKCEILLNIYKLFVFHTYLR